MVEIGIRLWKPLCRLHSSILLEMADAVLPKEPCNDIRYISAVVMNNNNSILLAADDE